MIWTHPLLRERRHRRKWWVKTVQVPVKITIIARDDILPHVMLYGFGRSTPSTFCGRGSCCCIVRDSGSPTSKAKNGFPIFVFQAKRFSLFNMTQATTRKVSAMGADGVENDYALQPGMFDFRAIHVCSPVTC